MEQVNVKAVITATSKKGTKIDGTPNTRKTAYLEINEKDLQKAKDFGLRQYTSREDKANFFMVQVTEEVDVYDKYGDVVETKDGGTETPNFHSDKKEVLVNILKGEHKGNTFYRLKAVQGELKDVEHQNPFAETSEDLPF